MLFSNRSVVGSVSLIVTVVPLKRTGEESICTQYVSSTGARYWCTSVCTEPTVRAIALSQSSPTPTTSEPFAVVVKEAVGAPGSAFPLPVVPMDPDGNPKIVIEEVTFSDNVAVTMTPDTGEVAVAAQSSAVPGCALLCLVNPVRFTNAQFKAAPVLVMFVTVVSGDEVLSAEMHTSGSSFGYAAEND